MTVVRACASPVRALASAAMDTCTHQPLGKEIWAMSPERRVRLLREETRNRARWIAAETHLGRERFAARQVQERGAHVFVPMCRRSVVRAGRVVSQVELLFPGIILVMVTRRWKFLTGIRGVTSVVMSGDQPGRLTASDLAWLSHLEEDGVIDLGLQAGDEIRVAAGRCEGLEGIFESSTARARCWVLLGEARRRVQLDERDVVAA